MTLQKSIIAAVAALILAAPLSAQRITPSALSSAMLKTVAPVLVSNSDIAVANSITAADSASTDGVVAPTRDVTVESKFYTGSLVTSAPLVPLIPAPNHGGRNGAMMIVGGAALVVGSVIGGDAGTLMMVGGGVVGLVGLWRYLQ